jgi:hypothetical protein
MTVARYLRILQACELANNLGDRFEVYRLLNGIDPRDLRELRNALEREEIGAGRPEATAGEVRNSREPAPVVQLDPWSRGVG